MQIVRLVPDFLEHCKPSVEEPGIPKYYIFPLLPTE
jgi:hypothetical protein